LKVKDFSFYYHLFSILSNKRTGEESSAGFNQVGREVKGHTHTYYQVLIDSRDCPFVVRIFHVAINS